MAGAGSRDRIDHDLSGLTFLAGGGEMGERMRALDWSATPLGDPHNWPQSLRSTLSMLLPSKAQIILFWGPEFVVAYNDAYRPVFGAKHPDALGRTGREAWSEIWDSVLHGLLADVVRTGEAFWGKDLLFTLERHGFPEETYFDVSYDPVRVESGMVGGVFCIVTETTERVIGERRMALLKDLAARNAAARTERDACVMAVDTIAANPHDITFALAFINDELQCTTPGADEQLATAPATLVHELAIPSSSSVRATLVVGLNPRRPLDDRYRAFLDLVADQFGTALANARAHEEERERAEALAAIDRAKTAFFNNVSHEFRTPLTLLLGPVQDALATSERALSADALVTVNRNALRLLRLVNTLLEFSRIEAGRAEASFEQTDLATFTTDLAGAFRSAIESAGLEFEVECAALGAPVAIDRAMWEKIVFNLLSNALKFTFEGRVRLSLRQDGDEVRLSVSDTGAGIPADQLPHVFERFHRVRGARSRTHEGTGIGLALVLELVRMHGGTITVDSVEGRGTTFTVSMPMAMPQHGDAIAAQRSPTPASSVSADAYVSEALGWVSTKSHAVAALASTSPGTARVLLADDNADMRDYVRRLLGERWEVEAVADGAAALASARARRPDIVVADVMMPALDGFELLTALRADPATQDVPVLLLSARAGEEATLKGIEAGADDYLVKPFTARDLVARVDAQLQRARARSAAAEVEARLMAASEQQRRFYDAVLSATPDFIYVFGLDHRFIYVNHALLTMWGKTWDEAIGHTCLELGYEPWHAEMHGREIDQVRATRAPIRGEVPFNGTHGRRIYDYIFVPVFANDGEVIAVAGTTRDVTDRRVSEDALRDSERRLKEANSVKDEFLSTLSHELRTPLNAILGWTHMLRSAPPRPEFLERGMNAIERNAKAQAQLVDDLLDVSRVISGKLALKSEDVSLRAVISEAMDAVRPALNAKAIRLRTDIDSDADIVVCGDAGRLRQVVWNLLSNAVKFTPSGGAIEVGVKRDDDTLVVSVRDTGVGIDAAFLPHVFERFRQAESAPSRQHGGLGLGLAIVRHLVEAHGGMVWASSDGPGTGSVFTFRLPLEGAKRRLLPAVAGKRPALPGIAGLRVLIADDDADARDVLRMLLEAYGAEVVAVASASEALAAVAASAFDALIADIGMPYVDGYSLMRSVRNLSQEAGARIPAIAVTAYASLRERDDAIAAGFTAHLGKPFDPDKLIATLAELTGTVARARSSAL
jgi:PAS domain S-box-containing protein